MSRDNNFRLKLIFPCKFETTYGHYSDTPMYHLPYGMAVLTAFLRKHGYCVEQEDLLVKFNRHNAFLPFLKFKNKDLDININIMQIRRFLEYGEIEDRLSSFIDKILDSTPVERFDIIGFSIFTHHQFLFSLFLSKMIKQRSDALIVFGGSFITHYGQLYPDVFNLIDYMIVGDGRIPLLSLIDYLTKRITVSEVPNLIYKEKEKLVVNSKAFYPLEDIPTPDFTDLPLRLYENKYIDIEGYDPQLPYQISRGCLGGCSFCTHRIKDKLEFKSYDKVISELEQMQEMYKSRIFHFCDDAINNSYEYLEGLCDLFIKNRLNISWNAYAKLDNLDKHILRKMKEAGCRCLNFGVESGSNRILKAMNKGITSEQASMTLKLAYETGLRNLVFLMAGYPYETQEDNRQTSEFIRKNRKYINYVRIYIFQLYYGSAIYCYPKKYHIDNVALLPSRYCFAFDESNGLKWQQKQRQQEYSKSQILKTIHKYIRFKNFVFTLLRLFGFIIAKIKRPCCLS